MMEPGLNIDTDTQQNEVSNVSGTDEPEQNEVLQNG